MHGSSSRDDRQKREQQRQEREMAKFAQMYSSAHVLLFLFGLCYNEKHIFQSLDVHHVVFGILECQPGLMLRSSSNNSKKILGLLWFPLNLELRLRLQIRISGRL